MRICVHTVAIRKRHVLTVVFEHGGHVFGGNDSVRGSAGRGVDVPPGSEEDDSQ